MTLRTTARFSLLLGVAFVAGIACEASEEESPSTVAKAELLRLTPTEYNNSVRDLLGMPDDPRAWPKTPEVATKFLPKQGETKGVFFSTPIETPPWPWIFPKETGVEEFEGMADGQEASAFTIEELQKASIHFASYTLISPIFFTCKGWPSLEKSKQEKCGFESLTRFAQRAFRRPITNLEHARLKTFWEKNWTNSESEEAIVLSVAGLLQSPQFVFRIEKGDRDKSRGDAVPLSSWEIASRLSYFLWDTMPDPELFGAAAAGELSTRNGVEKQARRMLEDPRARKAVVRFHKQLLGADKVHGIVPARRAYGPVYGISPEPPLDTTGDQAWPNVLGPVRHSMAAEMELFVERTVFDGAGTLSALLSDNHGYMSSATAPLYGPKAKVLPGPRVTRTFGLVAASVGKEQSLELYPTEFSPDERAGLLTLPAILSIGAYAVHPAPIQRGKQILTRLACEEFALPPAGVEADAPPDSSEAEGTNRTRTEEATSPKLCANCHNTLNPPGFAFENYDAMGRYREQDNKTPVDATGSIELSDGEQFEFKSGVELSHKLAKSRQVRDCYVLRWARYATGSQLAPNQAGLDELRKQFREDDHVKELLVAIAVSDLFRHLPKEGS